VKPIGSSNDMSPLAAAARCPRVVAGVSQAQRE
jgi:hypothetical protein